MEQDDRDSPDLDWAERIEAAYRRSLQGLAPVPWLPRVMNLTYARRTVARLRSGALDWHHPRMPAEALADTLEQGIELNLAEMRAERDLVDQDERELAHFATQKAELDEREMELFH